MLKNTTVLAIVCCLLGSTACTFCANKNGPSSSAKGQYPRNQIIGTYADLRIGERNIKIVYKADSSLGVQSVLGMHHLELIISREELPAWFDPKGYASKPDLYVFDGNSALPVASNLIVSDSLLAFPVFGRNGQFSLCFLRMTGDGDLQMMFDDFFPIEGFLPGAHVWMLYDCETHQLAVSDFPPARGKGTDLAIMSVEEKSFLFIKRLYVADEQCPVPFWMTEKGRLEWVRCVRGGLTPPPSPPPKGGGLDRKLLD
jgi:hypothetical protein